MKIKYLLFAVVFGAIVACDPYVEDRDMKVTSFGSVSEMMEGATIIQYSMAEDSSFVENERGMYIGYDIPNVPAVTIYYLNSSGSEKVVDYGKNNGICQIKLTSEEDEYTTETIYFRYVNANAVETVYSQEMTMECTKITPEMKLFAGNNGSKKWKWDVNNPSGQVWGNGAFHIVSGYRVSRAVGGDDDLNGHWWGIATTEEFEGQVAHTGSEGLIGDGDIDAYMIATYEDITCYNAKGEVIRKNGSWEITGYKEIEEWGDEDYGCGYLITSAGAILWPYEINCGGYKPTKFEIAYLTEEYLTLMSTDDGVEGGASPIDVETAWQWAEMTFWNFTSVPGADDYMIGTTYTWASDGNGCWGTWSFSDILSATAETTEFGWWAAQPEDIAEQIENYGYGLDDYKGATMTFNADGTITKSSGGEGEYELDLSQTTDSRGYGLETKGLLTTTGDGILMPVQINQGGATTKWFDIAYVDEDYLILGTQYEGDDENYGSSWAEGTFWRFQAVE